MFRPGDMIEWVYLPFSKPTHKGERIFSSTMNSYVPIDPQSLLVAIDTKTRTYTWLTPSGGVYSASTSDENAHSRGALFRYKVVPRKYRSVRSK